MHFANHIQSIINARKVFITSQGYIGIGPTVARKGDVCFLPFGARTPFILRPTGGDTFRLINESYISGFMQGEAMDIFLKGLYKNESIVLW